MADVSVMTSKNNYLADVSVMTSKNAEEVAGGTAGVSTMRHTRIIGLNWYHFMMMFNVFGLGAWG